jgi:prepilin-type N-terminal cleavage/methylation domain-containing protein/prepilin-type processing-associated H-X9-DG protein
MKAISGRMSLFPSQSREGFTLLELLVVIVIIAVLMGIALPVATSVRNKARMTAEINAGRQLTAGYLSYAAENDGELMPGYLAGASVAYPNGDIAGGPEAERYPWRLAPYVSWNENVFLVNDARKAVQGMDTKSSNYRYFVSLTPSLGLNTYCVGGYQSSTGLLSPNDVATKIGQVEKLSNLVAFVSSRTKTSAGAAQSGDIAGSFYVRPPIYGATKWRAGNFDAKRASLDFGNVDFRHGRKAVVTFLDGSVRLMSIGELRDMRLWARTADTQNYTVRP